MPPPPNPPHGPPLDVFSIEVVYFIVVFALCWLIYAKTREIYVLSKHEGIFYFRSVFLYFGLGYLFRWIHLMSIISNEVFNIALPKEVGFISLFLVTYFSTMAVLSLALTFLGKYAANHRAMMVALHSIALVSSVVVFLTRSHPVLMAIQAGVLLAAILLSFAQAKRLWSYNRVTYILLAVFWIASVLAFTPRLVRPEFKIPLYLLSACMFAYIYWRVVKRLKT